MSKHNRTRKTMYRLGLTKRQLGRPSTHAEIRAVKSQVLEAMKGGKSQ